MRRRWDPVQKRTFDRRLAHRPLPNPSRRSPKLAGESDSGRVQESPVARLGTPEDLGKAAGFLASDDSGYITGLERDIDGGAAQT